MFRKKIIGSIYLASTESELKRGWIKCGMTTRDSKTRISEGNVASVRERYEMLYTKETEHFIELEKHMHNKFENQKEWIKTSLPEAVAEINRFIRAKESNIVTVKKYNPKKHQQDAIDAVVKESKLNNKVSIVMPTGSGKTLTSLWITEALKSETVLFLAPSLQLIRQTKDAWAEQARVDFVWMACCSADDIDEREHAIEMGGGMVSTNPSDIDGFVRYMNGKKVVFSTYQSLPSVLACDTEFDIVISDEAHRTAGMSKNDLGLFNLVHSEKLKSKLRLFQTASPKVFKDDLLDIVESEDDVFAFDMNDEKLYGRIAYEMTLGEAIEKKLLCDYRIIAIGVDDEEVASHLRNRTYVAKGISADEAAASVAISDIFQKIDVSHMISFHSRLALAEMTSDELNKLGIFSETVKGTMSTKNREKAFERFKKKSKAVLTNAFALQEGIDIKKVDSIFFSSPKSSTISIVQAIGRALRLDPNNPDKIAAIVVPIYATGDPNVEIKESVFKSLYQLVSSISAVDYRIRAHVEGFTEGKGERGESKPIDYIKLADFERLDFINFTEKLRNAFIYGTLSKKRRTFEENLNLFKDFI
jgi:predicted helicase